MKRAGVFALIFLAAAGTAAATAGGRHSAAPSGARCGGPLWLLKTLSDPQRAKVDLAPQQTTIAAIRDRRGPGHPPKHRTTQFQLQTWEVPAQVTSFKLEATGALRLVLFDNGSYMNAVIPAPSCLSARTRDRAEVIATWQAFATRCGKGSSNWQSLGAIFFVRGVGFWSQKRQLRGAAPNGAELHPVTGLRVVVSC